MIPSTKRTTKRTAKRAAKRAAKQGIAPVLLLVACLAASACSFGRDDDELPAVVTPQMALANENAGLYERSAEIWHRLHLESGGVELDPYLGCGRSFLATGDVKSACAIVEQGLGVFPQDLELTLLHGEIMETANYHRAAERVYERAVELAPNSADAQLGLGRVRVRLGLHRRALPNLRKAAELRAGDIETLEYLALAADRTQSWLEAFVAHSQLLELEGVHDARRYVSVVRLAFLPEVREAHPQALEQALPWIEEAIRLDPQSSEAHYLHALHLETNGMLARAEQEYLRAVEIDPGNVAALGELAENYHAAGLPEEADRFARMALGLERDRNRRVQLEGYLVETD